MNKLSILVGNQVHLSAPGVMKDLIRQLAFAKATARRGRVLTPHADL